MDPKRKARRSSILKTRNDGGSGDLNLENVGKDNTLSGNLTGILPKRRVSFCHTNQVKEFENTNSSTEGSLSKTTDFNQTICDDMNMSVSILDVTNDNIAQDQDYEKTHCAENDMSFDGENHVTSNRNRKSTRLSTKRTSLGPEMSVQKEEAPIASVVPARLSQSKQSGNKTINCNQTMCVDMNMSVTMLDATRAAHQDYDKTCFGEKDMSFDSENHTRRKSTCLSTKRTSLGPEVSVQKEETPIASVVPARLSQSKQSGNKTINSNQTMCVDMNMSVTMLEATRAAHQDYDKTCFGEKDMSFDSENHTRRKSTRLSTKRTILGPEVSVQKEEAPIASVVPKCLSQSKQSGNKTINSNQTMCADMNMSVTMLDATRAAHQDYDKTCFGEKDMSFDSENHTRRKSTRLSTRRASEQAPLKTLSTEVNDMSLEIPAVPIASAEDQSLNTSEQRRKAIS